MLSPRFGLRGTIRRMLDLLRDIAPAILIGGSAALFAVMLWAGSRVH
jgi:hypothetical protein